MIIKFRNKNSSERRNLRVKKQIVGKSDRIRLCVYRSNRYIYCQLIDDKIKKTVVSAQEKELKLVSDHKINKTQKAKLLGELLAQKALKKKITKVVFDRNGYRYHGRVKAFAEGARSAGLKF